MHAYASVSYRPPFWAAAVNQTAPVGVDIELRSAAPDVLEALDVLPPSMTDWVALGAGNMRSARAVLAWSCLEAVTKLLGFGIAGPIQDLRFEMSQRGPARCLLKGREVGWVSAILTERLAIAVATERTGVRFNSDRVHE